MCPPIVVAVAAVAIAAASAATSVVGQTQARNAKKEFQARQLAANKKQLRDNRELATRAFLDQAIAANTNLAEATEAAAASNQDIRTRKVRSQGEVLAAAAEGGVAGLSLQALLADFDRQEGLFFARNEQNLIFKRQQTARQIEGFEEQAESRIAQVSPFIPSPVANIDFAGPLLSIAQSGAGAYAGYRFATKPAGNVTNIYNYQPN